MAVSSEVTSSFCVFLSWRVSLSSTDVVVVFEGSGMVKYSLAVRSFTLTLPWLKPRGFLIQRLTLKCSVLTAILKPFNRGDTTN